MIVPASKCSQRASLLVQALFKLPFVLYLLILMFCQSKQVMQLSSVSRGWSNRFHPLVGGREFVIAFRIYHSLLLCHRLFTFLPHVKCFSFIQDHLAEGLCVPSCLVGLALCVRCCRRKGSVNYDSGNHLPSSLRNRLGSMTRDGWRLAHGYTVGS